jgi:hypothetical protein
MTMSITLTDRRTCLGFLTAGLLIMSCDTPKSTAGSEDEPEGLGEDGEDPSTPPEGKDPPIGGAAAALIAEIDREMAVMKSSSYTHRTRVDEAAGVFDYDCSGFVEYALARSVPSALAALRKATVPRPLAKHLVAFLKALPAAGSGRWRRVNRVEDLRQGDIIAWLRPADSVSRNTGHVMIVHGPIGPDPGHPGAVIVPIADSTALPHRPGDSRSSSGATGLGRGEAVLIADDKGAPARFRWSRGPRSRERVTTIVFGRLE